VVLLQALVLEMHNQLVAPQLQLVLVTLYQQVDPQPEQELLMLSQTVDQLRLLVLEVLLQEAVQVHSMLTLY